MSYEVVPIDVMFRHEVEGAEGSDERTEVNVTKLVLIVTDVGAE